MLVTEPADNSGTRRGVWSRYKLPIILACVAVSLYIFSIVWIVFGKGGIA